MITKSDHLSQYGFFSSESVPLLVYSDLLSTFGYLYWKTAPGSLITNHEQRAAELLIEQFQYSRDLMDRPSRISQVLRTFVKQLQDVENAASDFTSAFNIFIAVGAQLDVIGVWLNTERLGRSDEEYRDELYYQIIKSHASGDPELVIRTLQRISGASKIICLEQYPAKISFFVNESVLADTEEHIIHAVHSVMPAGVGFSIINGGGESRVFSTDFDEGTIPDYAFGFDEYDYLEAGEHVGGHLSELITEV